MHTFYFFEDNISESLFRCQHDEIDERVERCCECNSAYEFCSKQCHYLIAFDIEATKNGYPSVFGIDCDVHVLCWGGHADETSVEVFCESCACVRQRHRIEKAEHEEQQLAKRRTLELATLAQKERQNRMLRDYWGNLSSIPFEAECALLLKLLGYEAKTTSRTNDGNIDIVLEKNGASGAVQCKAWNQPCGVKIVREFIGTVYSEDLKFGYLIAKSGFTASAKALLQRIKVVEGWDLDKLVRLAGGGL